ALSGILGACGCDPDLLRLQHDLFPAVRPRRAGYAKTLPCVRSSTAGVERAVVGWRIDSRRRLSAAAVLPRLVAVLGPQSRIQSMERDRPGMADRFAASQAQLSASPS